MASINEFLLFLNFKYEHAQKPFVGEYETKDHIVHVIDEGEDQYIDILKRLKGKEDFPQLVEVISMGVHRAVVLERRDCIPFKYPSDYDIKYIVKMVRELHNAGIAHGNISPLSILFDAKGKLFFTKLEGACLLTKKSTRQTTYNCPESQFPRVDTVNVKADYWCLGLTLYNVLTEEWFREFFNNEFRYPTFTPRRELSSYCNKLLSGLLCHDPENRTLNVV